MEQQQKRDRQAKINELITLLKLTKDVDVEMYTASRSELMALLKTTPPVQSEQSFQEVHSDESNNSSDESNNGTIESNNVEV